MDRITQLQDAILDLLTISSTAIEYITKRTQFEQVSKSIPATLRTQQAANRDDYKVAIETFTADLTRRAKDVEVLIAALPTKDDSGERAKRLQDLQVEMGIANAEHKEALAQAEELLVELQEALSTALGSGHMTKTHDAL
ncbi:MAG: hypothetical protein TREMPRED_003223 [Tremellales sp. Tagirdzhanova-0007]|nr:MAG: hypothetical protein TREMPRED_003223 [Tremellales sp. Tagirdzhanova-0007]